MSTELVNRFYCVSLGTNLSCLRTVKVFLCIPHYTRPSRQHAKSVINYWSFLILYRRFVVVATGQILEMKMQWTLWSRSNISAIRTVNWTESQTTLDREMVCKLSAGFLALLFIKTLTAFKGVKMSSKGWFYTLLLWNSSTNINLYLRICE